MSLAWKTKRSRSGESGATMVEFALTVMLFLTLLIGLIDFGLLFYCMVTVQHATAEGARYAVTGQQERRGEAFLSRAASIRKVIEDKAIVPRSRDQQLDIEIEQKEEDGTIVPLTTSGNRTTVTINVSYPYRLLLARIIGAELPITLRGRSVMRNERFPDTRPSP